MTSAVERQSSRSKLVRFVVLFFVPVAVALMAGAGLNQAFLMQVRDARQSSEVQRAKAAQVAAEAAAVSHELLLVHQQTMQAVEDASGGTMDAAQARHLHRHAVEQLGSIDQKMLRLSQTPESQLAMDKLNEARQSLVVFKQAILTTTELLPARVAQAESYLERAENAYVAYAVLTDEAEDILSSRVRLLAQQQEQLLNDYTRKLSWLNGAVMLVMLLGWLLVALAWARKLSSLSIILRRALEGKQADPDALAHVQRLAKSPHTLMGEMAQTMETLRHEREGRRAAEEALVEQGDLLTSIVNLSPIPIVVLDIESRRFLSFNEAASSSLGYSVDEFQHCGLSDVAGGRSPDDLNVLLDELLSSGGGSFDAVGLTKSGQRRDFSISVRVLTVQGKSVLSAVWTDITERKQNERNLDQLRRDLEASVSERTARLEEAKSELEVRTDALRRAHDELNAIFEAATVGIVVVHEHKILRCNRMLEMIFGAPVDGFVGQTTRVLMHTDRDYQETVQMIDTTISRGDVYRNEQLMQRRDGSTFWARIKASRFALGDADNAIICIIEDVSAERRVAHELQQAKDQAESANRAKSAFLANMSHEIRTPMNAIIGFTHLMQRDELNARQSQQVEKVQAAATHLLSVINDILDFSKIEAGKMVLEETDFELEAVVSHLFAMTTDKAEAKGLEMVARIDHLPAVLHGDGVRLGQVLLNYVSNAVKFTAKGSVVLTGEVVKRDGAQARIRFEVTDTGIGLSEAQQRGLFSAFQQADASTTRNFGGTGLGLAISRKLAELMGGQVGVRSQPGVGSTFWIEVPLTVVTPAVHPTAIHLLADSRVLVVDDAAVSRQLLAGMVEHLGAKVDQSASGFQALEAIYHADAEGQPYRLVLTDWLMAGMTGAELLTNIRRSKLSHQPPCLLVSGSSGNPAESHEDLSQFAGFLHKPVMPTLLASTVAQALNLRLAGATTGAQAEHAQALPRFAPGHRVLLAEDNVLNQEVAMALLSSMGLDVTVAEDGEDALKAFEEGSFDLVLMDIQMPRMDGLEATRRLRAMPQGKVVPVLAMTANVFAEDRAQALAAGMNDMIIKPVEPHLMARALMTWMPVHNPNAPARTGAAARPQEFSRAGQVLDALTHQVALDQARGLSACLGDRDKLWHFLQMFADDHAEDVLLARREWQGGDMASAQRRIHTLKGLAGTLGWIDLQGESLSLEQMLKSGATPQAIEAGLNELAQRLDRIVSATRHARKLFVHQDVPAAPVIQGDLAEPLRTLRRLLLADDLDSVDAYRRIQPTLMSVPGLDTSLVRQLSTAIEDFAFPDAISALDQLMSSEPLLGLLRVH
ncbi:MAG: response regulator [Aquabacterium sp.]|uniref:response regulator n=1 Tax=Aquabacterium sp. TaxID=1872578 RepID=UPI003BCB7774